MGTHRHEVPDVRGLGEAEMRLVRWLLENGTPAARRLLGQLKDLKVVSRCACGCASINFVNERRGGMEILGDFKYTHPNGGDIGVFAFAVNGKLAGIDLWSIDGLSNRNDEIPDPELLERVR